MLQIDFRALNIHDPVMFISQFDCTCTPRVCVCVSHYSGTWSGHTTDWRVAPDHHHHLNPSFTPIHRQFIVSTITVARVLGLCLYSAPKLRSPVFFCLSHVNLFPSAHRKPTCCLQVSPAVSQPTATFIYTLSQRQLAHRLCGSLA